MWANTPFLVAFGYLFSIKCGRGRLLDSRSLLESIQFVPFFGVFDLLFFFFGGSLSLSVSSKPSSKILLSDSTSS